LRAAPLSSSARSLPVVLLVWVSLTAFCFLQGLAPAEVRRFTRLQKQRVENQQPKKDKALATQNRPNPKKTGPIQQPRPGF